MLKLPRVRSSGDDILGYELKRRLGDGPFGEVWEADREGRAFRIKLLRPEIAALGDAADFFAPVHEAVSAHARIDHPYVSTPVRTLEDRFQQVYGVVSELRPGRPLELLDVSRAAQDGEDASELVRLLFLCEELGEGLHWIHHSGFVHGNLRASNVIVQRGEYGLVPLILDLSWSVLGVSASGGTPAISPEQFAGHVPTGVSDQWSFGTLVTRLLTSKRSDRSFGDVPAELVDTLARCRARDPRHRYPSMRDVVDDLRAVRSTLERDRSVYRRLAASEPGRTLEPPVPEARVLTADLGEAPVTLSDETVPYSEVDPTLRSGIPQVLTEEELVDVSGDVGALEASTVDAVDAVDAAMPANPEPRPEPAPLASVEALPVPEPAESTRPPVTSHASDDRWEALAMVHRDPSVVSLRPTYGRWVVVLVLLALTAASLMLAFGLDPEGPEAEEIPADERTSAG